MGRHFTIYICKLASNIRLFNKHLNDETIVIEWKDLKS